MTKIILDQIPFHMVAPIFHCVSYHTVSNTAVLKNNAGCTIAASYLKHKHLAPEDGEGVEVSVTDVRLAIGVGGPVSG